MSSKKIKKYSDVGSLSEFELEPMMKFQEMPLDVAIKKLRDSGISVSEKEASEILKLLHTLTKIIIKEFILSED